MVSVGPQQQYRGNSVVETWVWRKGIRMQHDLDRLMAERNIDALVVEGDDAAPLRLGEALSLDLAPREINGYWHDMTRTFAIRYASPELQQLYDQVREALERVVANLKVGEPTKTYQDQVCAFFEARNHPTIGRRDGLRNRLGLRVTPCGFKSHHPIGPLRSTKGALIYQH
jgi:methionine aminopeptidase